VLSKIFSGMMKSPPKKWSEVIGPAGALHLSLKRFGWSSAGAFRFVDAEGVTRAFTEVSPAAIKSILCRDWRKKLELTVGLKFGDQQRVFAGHAVQVLRSKRAPLTSLQRGCLESFLCQALWTKTKALESGYIVDDTLCSLCNEGQDTVVHRLLECEAVADLRAELAGLEELEALRCLSQNNPILAGLVIHPVLGQPSPRQGNSCEGVTCWVR
jgi:hypothetical protein